MRIVVAPDKFKGTLTAAEATDAMAAGVRTVLGGADLVLCPIADGGEGTAAAFVAAGATEMVTVVSGPLGQPTTARWARRGDTAFIEAAQANGLDLITPTPASSLAASTEGVGELILAALAAGCRKVVMGVGGSATTDGGTGMAAALGVTFTDSAGRRLAPGGGQLHRLDHVDTTGLDPRVRELQVTVACDVDNPLTGPHGAAAVYGPQKGAGRREIQLLDDGLGRLADVLTRVPVEVAGDGLAEEFPGRDRLAALAGIPGSGAAGGLAAAAIAFLGAELTSGADLVLDLVRVDDALVGADLVLTGEGGLDAQSLRGKAPGALAARARRAGVPVIAIAGLVELAADDAAAAGLLRAFSLVDVAVDAADARARAAELLTGQTAAAIRWWLTG